MSCHSCGKEVLPEYRLCPYCGTPIGPRQDVSPARPTSKVAEITSAPPPTTPTPGGVPPPAVVTSAPAPMMESMAPPAAQGEGSHWLDLGNSYYAKREYVKAGECYDKAWEIDPVSTAECGEALAYMTIKIRREKGIELNRIRPGVALAGFYVGGPSVERGGENLLAIILFNGSETKARVTAAPDFPKELGMEKLDPLSFELWPGQYVSRSFPLKSASGIRTKEYQPSITFTSESVKYRAAEKGIEAAAKVASSVIPFSGALLGWLGSSGLNNELSVAFPIKVTEGTKWTVTLSSAGGKSTEHQYYDAWGREWNVEFGIINKLSESVRKNKQYKAYKGIRKVVSHTGTDISGPLFLLDIRFGEGAPAPFRKMAYAFLFSAISTEAFRLCALTEKNLTREQFCSALKMVFERPQEIEKLILVFPSWYK